jgi:peptidoglycan hydrolase CwlO-like protein
MNNLLFIALIVAIIYYFYYYLPQNRKLSPAPTTKPLTHSKGTQTNPDPEINQLQTKNNELETDLTKTKKQVKDFLKVVGYNSYVELEKGIKEMKTKITDLQKEVRELTKRPPKPTNSKTTQTDELEKELDELIKNIQDLNNSL